MILQMATFHLHATFTGNLRLKKKHELNPPPMEEPSKRFEVWGEERVQFLTCVCSSSRWVFISDLGINSLQKWHVPIFLLQWISWMVKFAAGISFLLQERYGALTRMQGNQVLKGFPFGTGVWRRT